MRLVLSLAVVITVSVNTAFAQNAPIKTCDRAVPTGQRWGSHNVPSANHLKRRGGKGSPHAVATCRFVRPRCSAMAIAKSTRPAMSESVPA